MLDKFLNDDSTEMRLARTIVQGLVSVAIVAVPIAVSSTIEDPTVASLATAAIMCILSPIMSMFRTGNPEDGVVEADKGKED